MLKRQSQLDNLPQRFFCMVPKVLKQLNLPPEKIFSLSDNNGDSGKASRPWELLPPGHVIGTPAPLFKELVK